MREVWTLACGWFVAFVGVERGSGREGGLVGGGVGLGASFWGGVSV